MAWLLTAILILMILIISQIAIYGVFLKRFVTSWGATEAEISAKMIGDEIAPSIASTRAVIINAPAQDVWNWLMQLGADRAGFFSYYFIEKALGYFTKHSEKIAIRYPEFEVGDLVRGTIHEEKAVIPYNFPVVQIESPNLMVLEKWGTFLVKDQGDGTTRLIVRTHAIKHDSFSSAAFDFVTTALHFVMERGTLLGIKQRAETGEGPKKSELSELTWFLGIVVSCIVVFLATFFMQSLVQIGVLIALSTAITVTLFRAPPVPASGIALALLVSFGVFWFS